MYGSDSRLNGVILKNEHMLIHQFILLMGSVYGYPQSLIHTAILSDKMLKQLYTAK